MIRQLRAHPTIADGVLACALAIIALWGLRPEWAIVPGFTEPDALAVALALLQTLPLVFRRWWPMEIYALVGVSTVVYGEGAACDRIIRMRDGLVIEDEGSHAEAA